MVTYSIIGNGNAPNYFTLDAQNNGLVVTRDLLTRDSALSYTVRRTFSIKTRALHTFIEKMYPFSLILFFFAIFMKAAPFEIMK